MLRSQSMAHSLKPVRHLLHDKPTLQRLEHELRAQRSLLADVRQCLPPDLAAHCAGALRRDDTLVLHTDSAAWATRLRYLAPQLLRALAPEYPALRTARVRLLLPSNPGPRPKGIARHSERAAGIIRDCARYTKSRELREALVRLSSAVKSKS